MSTTTPRSSLPLLAAAQAQKHVTHNEALLQLDALSCARFLDRDLTAPPSAPADGDTYLIKATASGAWTGKSGQIAYACDGAWRFAAAFAGLVAYVVDESKLIVFDGGAWVDYASLLSLQNVPLLGVNTTADSTNKLAAKSAAILFDNVGNGVQAKLNKHASSDTASLLYQTNYSGRAEIGLAGDDDFHFKVSPDGSAWANALTIDKTTGAVRFLAGEVDVASAATCDIGAAAALKVNVTGTTAITSLGTAAHALRLLRFSGALTLTHNATSLILLGGVARQTAAGDTGLYVSDVSGHWRELVYAKASGQPLVPVSGRNCLINGNFAVNQRAQSGTVTLAAGQYGHDRWKAGASGCTYTFAASGADVVVTVSAGTLLQTVEGGNVAGGSYVASQAGTAQLRVYQGSPSGAYAAGPLAVTGLSGGANTTVEFSTGTISLAQLECGTLPTPFERIDCAAMLSRCQRYLQVWTYEGSSLITLGMAVSATNAEAAFNFFPMRAAPTVTLPAAGNSAGQVFFTTSGYGTPSGFGTHSAAHVNTSNFRWDAAGYSGLTSGAPSAVTAGGPVSIVLDAEI